jgi:hypothetical protein
MTVSLRHLNLLLVLISCKYELALRVEWCRSRARSMRWSEEVDLVMEEMRRVCAFLEWRANWWIDRARNMEESLAGGMESKAERLEGLYAYGRRQASMFRSMSARCATMWESTLSYASTLPRYNEHHAPGVALDVPGAALDTANAEA